MELEFQFYKPIIYIFKKNLSLCCLLGRNKAEANEEVAVAWVVVVAVCRPAVERIAAPATAAENAERALT